MRNWKKNATNMFLIIIGIVIILFAFFGIKESLIVILKIPEFMQKNTYDINYLIDLFEKCRKFYGAEDFDIGSIATLYGIAVVVILAKREFHKQFSENVIEKVHKYVISASESLCINRSIRGLYFETKIAKYVVTWHRILSSRRNNGEYILVIFFRSYSEEYEISDINFGDEDWWNQQFIVVRFGEKHGQVMEFVNSSRKCNPIVDSPKTVQNNFKRAMGVIQVLDHEDFANCEKDFYDKDIADVDKKIAKKAILGSRTGSKKSDDVEF